VLSVAIKGDKVYIELKTGPGKLTNTGAITPNGKPEVEVNVGFKLYEARRMAASVLAYIHAWDVMRMLCHHGVVADQQMVSRPMPYLLVAVTSEANGVQTGPDTPRNGTSKPSAAAANNDRPVTRKDVPKAISANAPATMKRTTSQPEKPETAVDDNQLLKYGDGHMVDGQNLTEVQTFQRYVTEKNTAPESKAVLLDYYRQRAQVPATVANQ
jgi:hypothetical protein